MNTKKVITNDYDDIDYFQCDDVQMLLSAERHGKDSFIRTSSIARIIMRL